MAINQAPTIEISDDGSQVVDGIIWIHPDRMSGAPCFAKTRVPIQNLFDYLESGASLEEFLIGFPPIDRIQAIKVLELARTGLFNSLSRS
jgi:uncharacterized protein (DUF433 family)